MTKLTLKEIYQSRVVSKIQPGEWEYPAQQVGEFPTTRPTPQQAENDLLGATPGAITMIKIWDLAPIDQSSFDPFEPPGRPAGPINTSPPVVTGTPQVGQTLSVNVGTWTGAGIAYTGQWLRNGNPIAGAAGPTYILVAADLNAIIIARITATNTDGATNATSNSVGPVLPLAPTNTVAPVVSGTTVTGNVLTTTNGTWANAPTSYTYRWVRGGTDRPIGGSTAQTLTLTAQDETFLMSCRVTATNAGGSTPIVGNAVGPITPTAADPDDLDDGVAVQPTRQPHRNGRHQR